jgi:hypothetical protein
MAQMTYHLEFQERSFASTESQGEFKGSTAL